MNDPERDPWPGGGDQREREPIAMCKDCGGDLLAGSTPQWCADCYRWRSARMRVNDPRPRREIEAELQRHVA